MYVVDYSTAGCEAMKALVSHMQNKIVGFPVFGAFSSD